jgi:tetratricopeptide (TPR) repeat protein
MRILGIVPGLLLCVPISAQFTDVIENARQRDLAGTEGITGHPVSPMSDGTDSAGTISKSRLAHKAPKKARWYFDQGEQAMRKNRTDDAVQFFTEAVRWDPAYWEAHSFLADLYWLKGQPAEALGQVEAALAIDPDSEGMQADKAMALLALERPDEAEVAARRALQLAPLSARNHYLLGVALLNQQHMTSETAEHLSKAAGKYPEAKAAYDRLREHLSAPTEIPGDAFHR